MARSPLLKALRQAYRIAQISRKSGILPTEVISRLNEKLSRRRLLQGGLALAGAAAATTFRRDNQSAVAQSGASPVLVVGAGIAGLTAAYRLKQAGVPVDIIEARNQVGGRIRSLPKAAGTQITAELGGEFIDTDHTCLRGLAEELGFNIVDLLAAEQGLIQETYFFGGRKVPIEEIINDFAPVAEQIDADLVAIENFQSYATPDPATAALDNLSITEYLERIPTTATMRQIIQVAYTGEYGREAVRVTEGLSVLFEFFGETYTQTDELSFPNFPIAVFNNGNLVGLNYLVADFDDSLDNFSIFSIFGDDTTLLNAGNKFSYQVNSFDSFEGNVAYSLDSHSTSIPEPDGVLGVSLLGIAWLLNRAIAFSHHAQITRLRRKVSLI